MAKIKRFIDCIYPATTCNLQCSYCYITQQNKWKEHPPAPRYSPEHIGKCMTQERLGGVCHINICGLGETLLPKEMPEIIENILAQGHYVMIITNGTLTKRFEELCKLPAEHLSRLSFKFSFHYAELVRRKMLDRYFSNIEMMRNAGCSFSVELVPYDELIPHIDEIKRVCMERLGALCHVTVARDEANRDISLLTKLSREEYIRTWSVFDSKMFDFKISTFGVKRREFCYAGDWSLYLNLVTGVAKPCIYTVFGQNIFSDPNKPIHFAAIGNYCPLPHCYNSHAFLTCGDIPELDCPTYADMRMRTDSSGRPWLQPNVYDFFSSKLVESNELYTDEEKRKANFKQWFLNIPRQLYLFLTKN